MSGPRALADLADISVALAAASLAVGLVVIAVAAIARYAPGWWRGSRG